MNMGPHTSWAHEPEKTTTELFIEFDGSQLTVKTDVAEVREYIAHSFTHMLAPGVTRGIGELEVLRNRDGYAIRGAQPIDFPAITMAELLPLLKDEVRLRFMRARPDLLWIHAGAVERDGAAVVLSGPSGHGKSTMTTLLCERGWRLLSDDIAPVRMNADEVLPFPQIPLRRIHPGREVQPGEVGGLEREAVAIGAGMLCREPAPIGAIVFVAYGAVAPTGLARIPQGSAAMEILRNATNFDDHKGAAVNRAAEMARRLPVYRLTYRSAVEAAESVNALW